MNLSIIAAGGIFPSGPTLPLADIAVSVEFSLQRRYPFYTDQCGIPVSLSYFSGGCMDFGNGRWEALLKAILEDVSQRELDLDIKKQPANIWFILPAKEIFVFPEQIELILCQVLFEYAPQWKVKHIYYGEHAQTGKVLEDIARTAQQAHDQHLDIVIALHSWATLEALLWLESRALLHGSHTFYQDTLRSNPYGRVPGEGAACIVISHNLTTSSWCQITSIAVTQEEVLADSDLPCTGMALSQAAKQAIMLAGAPVISQLVTDFNGETYRADELGFTLLRLKHNQLLKDFQQVTPALASGDAGCASMLLHMAIIAWRYAQNNGANNHTLLLSSADSGQRSATVMSPYYRESRDGRQN
ncbi:hypothetical protein [Erwinia sorbitola]|uniref:3-oxoacyl-ACP synthase n=1 Tax=Erwinia sorbitola TaxID=2681984 RepID=A0A6I6ER10_9GAMM|nr:hypothetical protein [Erwinia sorbitola]MTD28510.1 hypothetical protein [Erwinia sorbitola]QGU86623.1 hypothetical protein GN242_05045 [Erwinia sorbitola]